MDQYISPLVNLFSIEDLLLVRGTYSQCISYAHSNDPDCLKSSSYLANCETYSTGCKTRADLNIHCISDTSEECESTSSQATCHSKPYLCTKGKSY